MEAKSYGLLWHYDSINHWFSDSAIEALSCIKNEIKRFFNDNYKLKIFCSLVLSTIINTVSKQESDTRYAAVEKEWVTHSYVMEKYENKFVQCLEILENCHREIPYLDGSKVYLHNLIKKKKNHTDMKSGQ